MPLGFRPFLGTQLPAFGAADAASARWRQQRRTVCGAKRARKGQKQAASQHVKDTASSAPQTQPARITNVETAKFGRIKRLKRYIQQRNDAREGTQKIVVQRAWRKPKVEDDERRREEEARNAEYEALRKQKFDGGSFQSLYGTKGDERPPVLLVDGYNVLGAAIDYNSSDDDESQLEAAFADSSRELLQQRLVEYSHTRKVKVVLVFDAMGGTTQAVRRGQEHGGIDLVFTGDSDADTWIMLEVKALKEMDTPIVLVATSDRDLSDSLSGTTIVSCHALLRELAKAERDSHRWMMENRDRSAVTFMNRMGDRPGLSDVFTELRKRI